MASSHPDDFFYFVPAAFAIAVRLIYRDARAAVAFPGQR
jgi:hypothetical protein